MPKYSAQDGLARLATAEAKLEEQRHAEEEKRLRKADEEIAAATKIQALQQNLQEAKVIAEYQADAVVRQYDRQGAIVRSYKFAQIWPSNISAIDLAWDSNDTPEEYTVEFQVQYWTYANDVNSGNSISR